MTDHEKALSISRQFFGRLQDHQSGCGECNGNGFLEGRPADEVDDEECDHCDGHGEIHWPSWYEKWVGKCGECDTEDVPIQADASDDYYCLRCLVMSHFKHCGCDRWKKAEECFQINKENTCPKK